MLSGYSWPYAVCYVVSGILSLVSGMHGRYCSFEQHHNEKCGCFHSISAPVCIPILILSYFATEILIIFSDAVSEVWRKKLPVGNGRLLGREQEWVVLT